jgi:hypothetical protein
MPQSDLLRGATGSRRAEFYESKNCPNALKWVSFDAKLNFEIIKRCLKVTSERELRALEESSFMNQKIVQMP